MFKKMIFILIAALGVVSATQSARANFNQRVPLMRYFSPQYSDHWVTTQRVHDWSYNFESTLGFIWTSPAPGLRPVFECLVGGRDHMISMDQYCEGQEYLGHIGYIRDRSGPGLRMIRRCLTWDQQSHFVSTDIRCEGQRQEPILGFIEAR